MTLAWILAGVILALLAVWAFGRGWPGWVLEREGELADWEEIRLRSGADVTVHYACGDCLYPHVIPDEDLAGLTYLELSTMFPHLEIRTFTPDRLAARAHFEMCPEMSEYMTVILDPRTSAITVRHGRPSHLGPLHPLNDLLTHIDAGRLGPSDRADLERGIEVRNEEDLWILLEGLGH